MCCYLECCPGGVLGIYLRVHWADICELSCETRYRTSYKRCQFLV